MGQNHFEASQCPQAVRSAQDGERAPWAEAISGRDPGSRPMREKVLNALKIVKNQIKRNLKIMRFYDDN